MAIYRIEHGLIFDDNFSTLETDRWTLRSPENFITYNPPNVDTGEGGNVTLNHPTYDTTTSIMTEIPNEGTFLLQVEAEYTPKLVGDMGGIVVWKNALEKVEFVETMDSTTSNTYSTWRAIKRENMWTFFAKNSQDSWELFDSTICLDPNFIGVMLKGVNRNGYEPLNIKRIIACKGNSITVGNLTQCYTVNLLNIDGEIVRTVAVPKGYGAVSIELPTIPFMGKISIVGSTPCNCGVGVLAETEEAFNMYGGDVFLKGTDIKVRWRDKWLSELDPTLVGSLKNDEIELQMTLVNDTEFEEAENVKVRIAMYLDHFGWEWVDIAPDINGKPGAYDDVLLEVGHLSPMSELPFWVKITRQFPEVGAPVTSVMMKPTYFLLEVVNE